jgi:hypothetical protein
VLDRLRGFQVARLAQMVGIVDAYEAITTRDPIRRRCRMTKRLRYFGYTSTTGGASMTWSRQDKYPALGWSSGLSQSA